MPQWRALLAQWQAEGKVQTGTVLYYGVCVCVCGCGCGWVGGCGVVCALACVHECECGRANCLDRT